MKSRYLTHSGLTESLSKVPLIEMAGQNRVLIENHLGVLAYSLEEIQIKAAYGVIVVRGEQLRLLQLSAEQLVITGLIREVRLLGRQI